MGRGTRPLGKGREGLLPPRGYGQGGLLFVCPPARLPASATSRRGGRGDGRAAEKGRGGVIDTEGTTLKIKSLPRSGGVDRRGWAGDISGTHARPGRGRRPAGTAPQHARVQEGSAWGICRKRNPKPSLEAGGHPLKPSPHRAPPGSQQQKISPKHHGGCRQSFGCPAHPKKRCGRRETGSSTGGLGAGMLPPCGPSLLCLLSPCTTAPALRSRGLQVICMKQKQPGFE